MAGTSFFRQNALQDAQFSNHVKKQSFSAYESLDAGLTIKTKEGDLVTLTANTHAGLDAFAYNSKGIVETGSGTAMVTRNQREITLRSGERFSFSVAGDLSEQELRDIESIVKGIDDVISEMARGDMDDAVDKALSMGGYDTVSMYSADITYQRSYAMTSEIQADIAESAPKTGGLPEQETLIPSIDQLSPENQAALKRTNHLTDPVNRFVEQMAKELASHEHGLVEKARQPIDKLFRRQTREMRQHKQEETPAYGVMQAVRQQIAEMLEDMRGKAFKEKFSDFLT
jgi:hypothetical protein